MEGAYDSNAIAHFQGVLRAKRVDVMARLERNGHPIFIEELNGADKINRPQIIERHDAETRKDEEELRDIERSLQECEDGTYGRCPDCGGQIFLARKKAFPTASRCVPCYEKYKSQTQNNPKSAGKVRTGRRATN